MSNQYPGGVIIANPTPPAGPYENGAAPGIWTLDQATNYIKQGIWPTAGLTQNYIEDVFSAYLYTGNASTQTITNGINLSTKGGLVWIKGRSVAGSNTLYDTARGVQKQIFTDSASATFPTTPSSGTSELYAFNTDGFSLGVDDGSNTNTNNQTFVSWTFRKQPKFFDVVTWTGNDTTRQISHSLASVPGCILVKRYDGSGSYSWIVWHRAYNSGNGYAYLNATSAFAADNGLWWGNGSTYTAPTSTNFTISGEPAINQSGVNYVAYLFAHNAGGFGLTDSDNVISCGSFTTSGTGTPNATINLGYEPQFVLFKKTNDVSGWYMFDTMRGLISSNGAGSAYGRVLFANVSNSEANSAFINLTSTGFVMDTGSSGDTWIYVAIRKGPMKVPTDATKVFTSVASSATTGTQLTTGFPVDSQIIGYRPGGVSWGQTVSDRLRGVSTNTTASGNVLGTASMDAEAALGSVTQYWSNAGFQFPPYFSGQSVVFWNFRRAPGFFDEVCFIGDGTLTPLNHNLTVVPQLVITKKRSSSGSWYASQYLTAPTYGLFNTTDGFSSQGTSYPVTATTFVPSSNTAGYTHISYLFASCPGVSKVGSYTGTGATQTISCEFTGGARWVMVKRTDSTGDWYIWDTARGMVSGTDPSLLLNSSAAEVNANSIYTTTGGFQIVSTASGINASGGSYIYLAIA